jgi:hypothetical protein
VRWEVMNADGVLKRSEAEALAMTGSDVTAFLML